MLFFELFNLMAMSILYTMLLYHSLNIYQQEHYDSIKYLSTLPRLYTRHKLLYIIYLSSLFSLVLSPYHTIISLILCLIMVIKPPKYVVKLRITKRIIRLTITYVILLVLLFFIPIRHYVLFISINLVMPLLLVICNFINLPIERLINHKYLNQAKEKLMANRNLIKIAITGSYGKTSTKNIINHILEESYLTTSTPKSYNTLLGITRTINEHIKPNTEIFVCELGTNHIGEIAEMSRFLNPHIACITEVGAQHLETFKTIDNVLKAKFEIIESMGFNKTLILNGDNKLIKNTKVITLRDIYYIGMDDTNNIYAKDINVNKDYLEFTIIDGDETIEIQTKLLGVHNVYNILIAYTVIKALRKYNIIIDKATFIKRIKTLSPISHRLEYKVIDNFHIYDDSYNSNQIGFKNAIEVMKLVNTPKVIITPGIVDNGKMGEIINQDIASKLVGVFDDIYLVKNKITRYYENVLNKANKAYYVFDSFQDAFSFFKSKYKNKEVSLLIENDLPDNFLER